MFQSVVGMCFFVIFANLKVDWKPYNLSVFCFNLSCCNTVCC